MNRKSKAEKRKAKLKARKQQTAHNEQTLSVRLSVALEKLCESVMPEYIDDSNGPDLIGRRIVWRLGQIAWNIVVTGRRELASETGRQINTVDDLALALKQGVVKAKDLPINYIVRDGNTLIMNTRTAVALERAGIPRTAWYAVDQTGNSAMESLISEQLARNKLTSEGVKMVTQAGKNAF